MKAPRCTVAASEKTEARGFCHAWVLRMPCGLEARSHAAEPPITIACRRDCPIDPATVNRRRLPVHEW